MPIVYILVIDLKFYEKSTLVFSVKKNLTGFLPIILRLLKRPLTCFLLYFTINDNVKISTEA